MFYGFKQSFKLQVDGIDYRDYPDFCDAYISYAEYDGEPMNDEQLDELMDQYPDFVYEHVLNYVF